MGLLDRFRGAVAFASASIASLTAGVATITTATITNLTSSGIAAFSVANALTASATQTRAGGTALTKQINRVTTVATAGNAVTLPALSPGQWVDVYNAHATNAIAVFPNGTSDTIDGGTAAASVALAATKRARFTCVAANTIVSAQLGAVSA